MAKLKKYLVELTVSQQVVYEVEARNKWSAEMVTYTAHHKKQTPVVTTEPFLKLKNVQVKGEII